MPKGRSSALPGQSLDVRENLSAPPGSAEEIVVTALARCHVPFIASGDASAQIMRSLGLATAGNDVQFALDRQ